MNEARLKKRGAHIPLFSPVLVLGNVVVAFSVAAHDNDLVLNIVGSFSVQVIYIAFKALPKLLALALVVCRVFLLDQP